MREILFRGKRIDNGEWAYGCYYKQSEFYGDNVDCHEIIVSQEDLSFDQAIEYYDVDPETVGQYTGLTDKNGKKIFEGDIIKTQPFSDRPYSKKAKFKQHIGVVEYHICHFKNSLYEQDYEANWRVNIKDYGGYGCCAWSAFFKCEVIGNIHDNLELLEGDQDGRNKSN